MNPEILKAPQPTDALATDNGVQRGGRLRSMFGRKQLPEISGAPEVPELTEQYGDKLVKLGEAWNGFNAIYADSLDDPDLEQAFRGFVDEATNIGDADRQKRRRIEQLVEGDKERRNPSLTVAC